MRIGVIGTGVAGSLLLECLGDVPGFEVLGFERVLAGAREEAGTGLNLCPNALKALRLYRPARHAALRAASLPWRRWSIDLADGERLFDLDLLDVAEEPGVRLRWAELYRLLREPVADRTRHGHALEALEEDAAGRLVPVFRLAEGGLARHGGFDLLVAGDGRYSALRVLTAGVPQPEFMGVGMWRLLVPEAADCPYDDYGQWFNGNSRLLSYRLPGGGVYIAGSFPLGDATEITPEMQTVAYQRACYLPADATPCAPMAWMVDRITSQFDDIHWARLQLAPQLRRAADDRALFLGDAAHAMVPTLGQGATQAIEDGVLTAAVLAGGGSPADVAALRDPRVRFIREFSVEATDTLLPGSDVVRDSRAKLRPEFLAKLRQAYTDVPSPAELSARSSARSASPPAGTAG